MYSHLIFGADRDRTDDLLLAKQALSQLSYSPLVLTMLVGPGGIEPPTSRLSSVRSDQLSYEPMLIKVMQAITSAFSYFMLNVRVANLKQTILFIVSLFLMIDLYLPSEEEKYKGGDPAAPSGTATLLRLHPNY